jgi:hypothetical protein
VRYILYAILIYIAYQFIFNLVIPVYKTTRKIKKGFREMHGKMQEQVNKQQATTGASQSAPKKEEVGDYIDFEEVK